MIRFFNLFRFRSDRFWQLALFLLAVSFYSALAIAVHTEDLVKDEDRYLEGAANLRQGFFVSPENPDFVNGPGYPLVLVPFGNSGAGILAARLFNGLLVGLAAVLLYRMMRRYGGQGWAVAAGLLTITHPALLEITPFLMSDALALFCVSAFAWSFTAALRAERQHGRWIAAAAVSLGFLIMTRVFFGYVLLAMLALSLLLMVLSPWRAAMKRAVIVFSGAFLLCLPYLGYTRAMTGRTLCWSTNSGELLYWFTSTRPGENGRWCAAWEVAHKPEFAPHREFYLPALKLPVLEREAVLTTRAMEQLKAAPAKVGYNWVCNVSRMMFGFPRSFQMEDVRRVGLVAWNGLLIIAAGTALVIGIARWRSLRPEIALMLAFALVFTGGSTLAPSLPRYFVAIVPIYWLCAAAILTKNLRVSLRMATPAPVINGPPAGIAPTSNGSWHDRPHNAGDVRPRQLATTP